MHQRCVFPFPSLGHQTTIIVTKFAPLVPTKMLRALEMGGNYFLINFLMIDEFNLACLPHHMHAGIIIPTHTHLLLPDASLLC